jgi:hypothetical protein
MKSSRRPLLVAAVLCAVLPGGVAEAQTVIARHVPENATVQANIAGSPAVAATIDSEGNAVVALDTLDRRAEVSARLYVFACETRRQIVLADRGAPVPSLGPGCSVRELPGVFVVRRGTALVIDLQETPPSVRIAQGPAPRSWLKDFEPGAGPLPAEALYRLGVFAGGGFSIYRGVADATCGDASGCRARDATTATTIGISYWMSPLLGVEASYGKDAKLTASGQTSPNATFTSETDPEVFMVAGKVGMTVNRVGLYARGGANFHRATTIETDVVPNITRVVNGITVILPGGTLATGYRTEGWGWLTGGGLDVRATDRFGVYLDARLAKISGTARDESPVVRDTLMMSFQMGLRFSLVR